MNTSKNLLTNDVYKIAEEQNVLIICEPLGNIRGYYHIVNGQKMIHVNESLDQFHRDIAVCKLMYSYLRGEKFVVLQSNRAELENDLLVHCLFSVFSVFTREIGSFSEQARKQVLNATSDAYKQLLKVVS